MRSLAPLFPVKTNLQEPIGEVWLTGVDCKIESGPFAGKTLGEAWQEMTIGWRGSHFQSEADFPLLLKFIFPADKLSIQVHPDDEYAAMNEAAAGGRGKTEMWYVLSAEPGARLLAGLRPGVPREKVLASIVGHTLEDLFQSYEAHAGDTFFIPAGMPHTIGPGMVICEVQEYSDLTYRLYDYGRVDARGNPRELHVEKAMEVIDLNSKADPKAKTHPLFIGGKRLGEQLIDCPYFATWKFDFEERMHMSAHQPRDEFDLWVFLEGEGTIGWSSAHHGMFGSSYSGEFRYQSGECWFIPGEFGSRGYYPKHKTSLLMASPRNPKLNLKKGSNAG